MEYPGLYHIIYAKQPQLIAWRSIQLYIHEHAQFMNLIYMDTLLLISNFLYIISNILLLLIS